MLVDFILKWIQQQFNIEIDIFTIEESLRELPFLDWSSDLLAHTAHFIESFFIILVILLFLIIGETNKEKTLTWNTMDNSIKKYISSKVLVAFGNVECYLTLNSSIIWDNSSNNISVNNPLNFWGILRLSSMELLESKNKATNLRLTSASQEANSVRDISMPSKDGKHKF